MAIEAIAMTATTEANRYLMSVNSDCHAVTACNERHRQTDRQKERESARDGWSTGQSLVIRKVDEIGWF